MAPPAECCELPRNESKALKSGLCKGELRSKQTRCDVTVKLYNYRNYINRDVKLKWQFDTPIHCNLA